jgi:glycosyltransferase involved in cell wall biosynthesis
MIRVLVDGRLRGHDGIGRYTTCLIAALRASADQEVHIQVLEPTGTPRYSRAEGVELVRAAHAADASIIHLLDYRVPLEPIPIPIVATVHDVLRLDPRHCYSDAQFAARFGNAAFAELGLAVQTLRRLTQSDAAVARANTSVHAEFYARMLAWACQRSDRVVTPTKVVAQQLAQQIWLGGRPTVTPWGIDHPEPECAGDEPCLEPLPPVVGRYLLYVGQARAHKRLPTLLAAYQYSDARREQVRLVCVGRDFVPGADGQLQLHEMLGSHALALGTVSDRILHNLYARAEALIHLAEHEGFGFTPLEAMATGARVIASDIPTLRETLGAHADFADPTDPRDGARAINRLLAEPDSTQARRQRAHWAARYSWSRHAGDILDIYRECPP